MPLAEPVLPAPSNQDDPLAKALQQVTHRAELSEEKNRQYEARIEVLLGRISDKDQVIAVLKEQKGGLGEANTLRQEARVFDLERIADRDKLIAKQDAEISRLRNPGLLGTLFNPQFLKGSIAGYGICKAVSSFGGEQQVLNLVTGQSGFAVQSQFAQPYPLSFYGQTDAEQRMREALKKLRSQ